MNFSSSISCPPAHDNRHRAASLAASALEDDDEHGRGGGQPRRMMEAFRPRELIAPAAEANLEEGATRRDNVDLCICGRCLVVPEMEVRGRGVGSMAVHRAYWGDVSTHCTSLDAVKV